MSSKKISNMGQLISKRLRRGSDAGTMPAPDNGSVSHLIENFLFSASWDKQVLKEQK